MAACWFFEQLLVSYVFVSEAGGDAPIPLRKPHNSFSRWPRHSASMPARCSGDETSRVAGCLTFLATSGSPRRRRGQRCKDIHPTRPWLKLKTDYQA
ncbi:hypothetical protein V8C40DRAFT_98190 [Trichoderma camerunense]